MKMTKHFFYSLLLLLPLSGYALQQYIQADPNNSANQTNSPVANQPGPAQQPSGYTYTPPAGEQPTQAYTPQQPGGFIGNPASQQPYVTNPYGRSYQAPAAPNTNQPPTSVPNISQPTAPTQTPANSQPAQPYPYTQPNSVNQPAPVPNPVAPAVNPANNTNPAQGTSTAQPVTQSGAAAPVNQAPSIQGNTVSPQTQSTTPNNYVYTDQEKTAWLNSCIPSVTDARVSNLAQSFCLCGWQHIASGQLPANLLTSTNPADIQQRQNIMQAISEACVVQLTANNQIQ